MTLGQGVNQKSRSNSDEGREDGGYGMGAGGVIYLWEERFAD